MILIVCALECEAKPIITRLGLKKTSLLDAFQTFAGKDTYLIVSGVGNLKAAIATTAIITKLSASTLPSPVLIINIGICGSSPSFQTGEALFPHTISSPGQSKKYFQEILIKHDFKEVSLSSVDSPVTDPGLLKTDCVDMEAYGFFQAASTFLKTSQIYCVKVVSDNCCGTLLSKDVVSSLIDNSFTAIYHFYSRAFDIINKPEVFTEIEKDLLKTLSVQLNLTQYQDIELEKLALSYKIRKSKKLDILDPFLRILPKNKTEVKDAFNKIQRALNAG